MTAEIYQEWVRGEDRALGWISENRGPIREHFAGPGEDGTLLGKDGKNLILGVERVLPGGIGDDSLRRTLIWAAQGTRTYEKIREAMIRAGEGTRIRGEDYASLRTRLSRGTGVSPEETVQD